MTLSNPQNTTADEMVAYLNGEAPRSNRLSLASDDPSRYDHLPPMDAATRFMADAAREKSGVALSSGEASEAQARYMVALANGQDVAEAEAAMKKLEKAHPTPPTMRIDATNLTPLQAEEFRELFGLAKDAMTVNTEQLMARVRDLTRQFNNVEYQAAAAVSEINELKAELAEARKGGAVVASGFDGPLDLCNHSKH